MKKIFTLKQKKFKRYLIFGFSILLLVINSCKKELIDSQNASSINWARDYYNTSLNTIKSNSISSDPSQQTGSSTGSKYESKPTPLWHLATNGENNGFSFVEVPLGYKSKMSSIIIAPGQNPTDEEKKDIASAAFDILLIYKNKEGSIKEQVVSLIPDIGYLKKHSSLKQNKLAKLDTAFSGYLVYNGWKGDKMYLERIENGLLVRTDGLGQRIMTRAAKPTKSSRGTVMRATMGGDENCTTVTYSNYWVECQEFFSEWYCTIEYTGGYSVTYCSGGGGGNVEETVFINAEDPGDKYELTVKADSIKIVNRLNCFNNVPTNANTTYSARICADIPVNGSPALLIDATGAVGHTFIELTKTNGTSSVTETFGFYPKSEFKATFQGDVASMMVDNEGHLYDASLLMKVNKNQFDLMVIAAEFQAKNKYSMTGYNCTNYALNVFNAASATTGTLNVPDTAMPISGFNYGITPNGLYKKIKTMQENNQSGASINAGNGSPSTNCN